MTETVTYRYSAGRTRKLMRSGASLFTFPLRAINKIVGSSSDSARIFSRLAIVLAAAFGLAYCFDWIVNFHMIAEQRRQLMHGEVLDHIYSFWEVTGLVGGWIIVAAAAAGILDWLRVCSDANLDRDRYYRPDKPEDSRICLWVIMCIAVAASMIISFARVGEPDRAEFAPLHYEHPADVYFPNSHHQAVRLAAKQHLAVGSCHKRTFGSNSSHPLHAMVCRDKGGVSVARIKTKHKAKR